MDQDRFDDLTQSIADGSSRRSIFKGLAGGGLAGLLAFMGLDEATAGPESEGDRRRRRRRARRRRTQRTQNNRNNGITINLGDTNLIANGGTVACNVTDVSILRLCQSGFCNETSNTCAPCPENRVCGREDNDEGLVCCIDGFVCGDLGCVARSI